MTITVVGFLIVASMIFLGYEKQAACAVLLTCVGGLAYRYFLVGDSLREIAISLGLFSGLLAIGVWGAMGFQRIIEDYKQGSGHAQ